MIGCNVGRLEEGSFNITYDYKNSSIENDFFIKFQNFCRKHFLVTLYHTLMEFITPAIHNVDSNMRECVSSGERVLITLM